MRPCLRVPTGDGLGGSSFEDRICPGFEPDEAARIMAWSARMRARGVYCEINHSHVYLSEALHVLPGSHDDPWWLVHKTPEGAAAVRLWPGLARIVPSIDEALAIITEAIDQWTVGGQSLSGGSHGNA